MFCPKCGIENPDNGKFCRSCGANLINVLAIVNGSVPEASNVGNGEEYAELYSTGVRNTILGAGFLVTSVFLFTLPGNTFFWVLAMIPAFSLIASGVQKILKSEAMKKQNKFGNVPQLAQTHSVGQLPPTQNDYIKPQKSPYKTDELLREPSSVTDETTRRLQANLEGQAMSLPKIEK